MSILRMGYVGCGRMAQRVHIPNIIALDACELVAVAEVCGRLGERVCQRLGIPRLYPSHRELVQDPDIQAVAVSGHFYVQGQIAIDALKAGKDVFMEKPMAVSVEQAERIVAAERASGRRLMVAYMKRYDPGNLAVKRAVEQFTQSGELGEIRYVRNHGFCGDWEAGLDVPEDRTEEKPPPVYSVYPPWLIEEQIRRYLGYLQQYTHNVNLVRWFLDGRSPVRVRAVDLDADNGMRGVVILDVGGVRAVIESGSVAYHGWDEHTQIYFEKGWVRTEAPPLLLRNAPATVEVYNGSRSRKVCSQIFPEGGREWSYKAEMRHFVESVLSGQPFRSPAADALEDARVFEAVYSKHLGIPAVDEPAGESYRAVPAQPETRAGAAGPLTVAPGRRTAGRRRVS
ncbi:MAG: Gfo/Idh/MocA family oxidoreductase [Kiritimatiellae bacterium]|nr:Gfo/Idh/MocA family oxidoreductase [Kiritimatiellia bacterium]